MSEMSKCNTGISLTLHKLQQFVSMFNYYKKGKNSPIFSHGCEPTPACDFAVKVESPTEQITQEG